MLLDTHVHLIDKSRLSYLWLEKVPSLNQDASYADYDRTARRVGIIGALHMEVDVSESDISRETEYIGELMGKENSLLLGGIASGRPESDGFAAYLETVDRSVVRGLRRILHEVPDDVSTTALFRENIRRLGGTGLVFDICMLARQLPLAMELVDSAPDVTFVLDHCGVPDIENGAFEDWAASISQLARRPNLNAKISGVIAYTGGTWTLDTIRPYVEHVIESFGWDRVVWGSDSPVCTLGGTLESWVAATHALISGCSKDERRRLMQDNARRIWQL